MTVYVDNVRIPATVGPYTARWSHLTADTRDELHTFAARLGLKRAWFQEPKGINGKPPKPGSYSAECWHYDVTDRVRRHAIKLGAIPVHWLDLPAIIKARLRGQHADDPEVSP